ncbi:MAG TPA: hypothetical protein VFY64_02705 [Nitrososphaeraceae archaeon]|nr:hypothetical protein [Nitrososphaeraceae archaeon]
MNQKVLNGTGMDVLIVVKVELTILAANFYDQCSLFIYIILESNIHSSSSCCFKGINIVSNGQRKMGLLYVFVESISQVWGSTYSVMHPL